MAVTIAFLAYVPIAALCFALAPPRAAMLAVLIGGWLLLPVGHYPPPAFGDGLAWWVTGIALPSDMMVTKAWVAPVVTLAGAVARDPQSLRAWRPGLIDVPIAAWTLWPLIAGIGGDADPAPIAASLYLIGAWGAPWLIGRVWFADADGGRALLRALALSGLANLSVAIVEGARPAWLYTALYGYHPFQTDGIARYVGYRPLGFLEDGNLYGLWAALSAFAAIWLARHRRLGEDRRWRALAIVDGAIAVAAQSAGALLLLLGGLVLVWAWRRRAFRPLAAVGAAAIVLAGLLYLSGVVPVQRLAHSAAGAHAIAAMRSIGRGSLPWRVSQDAKTLATIAAHPVAGTGQWDWWRGYGTRPWGQAMLLLGQYGAIGLALAWGALASAVAIVGSRRLAADAPAVPLAIIVALTLLDATLNAFFFAPAIVAAGAIAGTARRRRTSVAPGV